MAAPLSIFTKEEQRAVLHFLWAEGVQGFEIHRFSSAEYGDNVLLQWSIYEWIEMFKNGQITVTDAECSGCPSTYTSDDKQEQARAMILMTE
jgi:hypothetical protein